jgi:hypothetical protein
MASGKAKADFFDWMRRTVSRCGIFTPAAGLSRIRVTYISEGKQYVLIPGGRAMFAFSVQ